MYALLLERTIRIKAPSYLGEYTEHHTVTAQTCLIRQNTINKLRSVFLCDTDTTDITCCINNVTSTWQANITFIYWWIKWTTVFQSGPSMLSFFFVHCLLKHLKKKWETLTQDTFGGGNGGGCSCTSWKYLWLIASIADNRLLGSYVKSFMRRSVPSASSMGTISDTFWASQRGNILL